MNRLAQDMAEPDPARALGGALSASRAPGPAFLAGRNRLWWLAVPLAIFFVFFFVIPVLVLLANAFDKPAAGSVAPAGDFVLTNFQRFLRLPQYYNSALLTIYVSFISSIIAAILGYPLAYLIAKTEHPAWNTFLMILVLASMQLDGVIRLYGMMVLLGDNGLINGTLIRWNYLSEPLPLMYNIFGVVVGTVQITLPFMVLSLIGVIRNIHPSFQEAARSLGASPWWAFRSITLPLTMPGLLAGTLLVFALASSSYVVAALMGGWKVWVLPVQIFERISNSGQWQFGAALATILLVINVAAVFIYQAASSRMTGGRT